MTTIAFFNNKGGVGKTTLVYHVAAMLTDLGHRVLMLDLDPQSNLSAMGITEQRLEELWPDSAHHPSTLLGALQPIIRGLGDIDEPHVEEIDEALFLVPGDLGLSTFEDRLSDAWPRAMDGDEAAFRTLSAFHRIRLAAEAQMGTNITLIDIGPNLGAINRAALLAADNVVTPLAPDIFSMQGLRNLGPTLRAWRQAWEERLRKNPDPELSLPSGTMRPIGYIVMQTGMRLKRPVQAFQRWIAKAPMEYHNSVLSQPPTEQIAVTADPYCLGVMKHYHSLMPLAQDAQKPMFRLRPADGAIGAHQAAVGHCRDDFEKLTRAIIAAAMCE